MWKKPKEGYYMDVVVNNLPILAPIFIIQLILIVVAIIDLVRNENTNGPKWLWALIILFINIIGPVLYFVIGRKRN
jgi:hypothetical protein